VAAFSTSHSPRHKMAVERDSDDSAPASSVRGNYHVQPRIPSTQRRPQQAQQLSRSTDTVPSTGILTNEFRATTDTRDLPQGLPAGSASQTSGLVNRSEVSTRGEVRQRPSEATGTFLSTVQPLGSTTQPSQAPPSASATQSIAPGAGGESSKASAPRPQTQLQTTGASRAQIATSSKGGQPPRTNSPRLPPQGVSTSPSRGPGGVAALPSRLLAGGPPAARARELQPFLGAGGMVPPTLAPGAHVVSVARPSFETLPDARHPSGLGLGSDTNIRASASPSLTSQLHSRPSACPPPGATPAFRPLVRPFTATAQPQSRQLATGTPPRPEEAPVPLADPSHRRSERPHHTTQSDAGPSAGPSSTSQTASKVSRASVKFPERKVRLSIEAELVLTPRRWHRSSNQSSAFVKILAENYNKIVGNKHPRMRSSIIIDDQASGYETVFWNKYSEWCLVTRPEFGETRLPESRKLLSH
jgi:hypothetical protein